MGLLIVMTMTFDMVCMMQWIFTLMFKVATFGVFTP